MPQARQINAAINQRIQREVKFTDTGQVAVHMNRHHILHRVRVNVVTHGSAENGVQHAVVVAGFKRISGIKAQRTRQHTQNQDKHK